MEPDFTIIETSWGDQDAMIHIKRDSQEFKAAENQSGYQPQTDSNHTEEEG